MMPDMAIDQCEGISSVGPVALSAEQGSTPTSVGIHNGRISVAFSRLHTTRGRRGTDDPVVTSMSVAILSLFQRSAALSSSGERAEHAAFSPLDLSQCNMRPAKPLGPQNQPQRRSAEADIGEAAGQ